MPSTKTAQAQDESPAIGIDLGTTYSAVAAVDDHGKPFSILNQDGELLTPTAVLVDDQQIVVGREAVSASVMEPQSYADCFKRDVGSTVFRHGVRGVELPPEVLSAFVLERLRLDAERRLGPVRRAVITVPAFFDEARRKATQDAGRLAGLEVLDIINEPTAAALAYGYQQGLINLSAGLESPATRVLVYDLGGGTFDVTILEVAGTTYRAIATDGDVQLGGKDFDERIVGYLAERFVHEHGVDPRSDPQDAAQLWIDAQKVKHSLSHRSKTNTVVFHAGMRSSVEITREMFEQLTRDLLERTETTTSLVVQEAALTWGEIDRVLLVGGSTRMPAVAEMLQHITGKEVDQSLSPDEAVAQGAALHAAMLTRRQSDSLADCQLVNVNSHSLGVRGVDRKTKRSVNSIMIPKNTPLPCKQARVFTTAEENQQSVRVVVLEGESSRPDDCIELGDCVIRGLPAGLPKGSKIEVTYQYQQDGRVAVSARMPATRQSARVEIRRNHGADLEDLEAWRGRLLAPPSVSGTTPTDPGSALRRLDELYGEIGAVTMKMSLPPVLKRAQQAALKAAQNQDAAAAAHQQATTDKASAASPAEAVQASSRVAKSQTALEQAQTQASFASLVLGRECVKHQHVPNEVAGRLTEIQTLKQQFGL